METGALDFADSICRLCLNIGAKNNIFSIHKPTSLPYSHIFSSCIPLQVEVNDILPKKICQKCLNQILNFYGFKNKVLQNDLKLRQMIQLSPASEEIPKLNCNVVKNNLNDTIAERTEQNFPDLKLVIKSENKDWIPSQNEDMLSGEHSECDVREQAKENIDCEQDIYQCNICGKISKTKRNLKQHYQKHIEKTHGCDVCGQKFVRAHHLIVHKRIHTGEKPYSCTVCSKSFRQSSALKTHVHVHSGECPYVCDKCGKMFKNASSLYYHKKTHSNETLHVCKICQKSFKKVGYLTVHMRFHDNKRPFSCNVCNQKFFTGSHLNVHVKRHNNDTPFKCIVCEKSFVRPQHLKTHLTTHTGERAYACTLCSKKFTQSSHLNRHMKVHKSAT